MLGGTCWMNHIICLLMVCFSGKYWHLILPGIRGSFQIRKNASGRLKTANLLGKSLYRFLRGILFFIYIYICLEPRPKQKISVSTLLAYLCFCYFHFIVYLFAVIVEGHTTSPPRPRPYLFPWVAITAQASSLDIAICLRIALAMAPCSAFQRSFFILTSHANASNYLHHYSLVFFTLFNHHNWGHSNVEV